MSIQLKNIKINQFKILLDSLVKKINWKSPKSIAVTVLLAFLVIAGTSFVSTSTYAVSVSVNGQQLGYVSDMAQAEKLVSDTLAKQGEGIGVATKTSDQITYKRVWVSDEELLAKGISEGQLISSITPHVEGYGLTVGGKVIAVLPTEAEVDKLLAAYKDQLTQPSETNKIFSADFVEEVAKQKVNANLAEVKTYDEALNMLIQGNVTTVEHKVVENDSLWSIARKNNMYTQELLAANPDIKEDSILQLGQIIKISTTVPYLTVISKGEKTVKETIPFSVQTKLDNSIAAGKSVVKQAGKAGEKEVSFTYTEENGKIVEKTVVKETVISEPVKQLVAQGPSRARITVSTSRGSGSISGLSWPMSGRINSNYGYRRGEFHTGIDIDGDVGQPYAAAAAGKVVEAGWHGNYGKLIAIDHGNGVVTRYAHSSQLLVSIGQTVSKGETIGYVGNTGRSSGPHLHFEVIINGSSVNPYNYL